MNFIKLLCNAIFSILCILINTAIVCIPLLLFSFFKLISPSKPLRFFFTSVVQKIASVWVSGNVWCVKSFSPTEFIIEQDVEVDANGSYLIISNHKSWLDTLVLQYAFHKKVSFPKFFMKFQMFFVPLIGVVCWALEFPAMRRYSKKYLAKHPDKIGQDIKKTEEYCKNLPMRPTSIINFVEGTRYTLEKARKSNYVNLLNPKAGGIAVILQSLSDRMLGVLNTTIIYDNPNQTLWGFLLHTTKIIRVKVEFIPIAEIPLGDYFNNDTDKLFFQKWLNNVWTLKDEYISYTRSQLVHEETL